LRCPECAALFIKGEKNKENEHRERGEVSNTCCFPFFLLLIIGKDILNDQLQMNGVYLERRKLPKKVDTMRAKIELNKIGTIGRGFHTARLAWSCLIWAFQIGGVCTKGAKDGRPFYASLGRTPKKVFDLHPVDLLIVDSVTRKDYEPSQSNPKGLGVWLDRIERAEPNNKPKVVIESWDDEELFDDKNGPASQKHNKLWERAGYESRIKRWNAERGTRQRRHETGEDNGLLHTAGFGIGARRLDTPQYTE
jgi:hypothetical protein